MHELGEKEIRYITETVSQAGITFSHLRDDLVDHLCCEVEQEIEKGLDFQQAVMKINSEVGIDDLRSVQKKTLFLIDKNYRIMKNLMKISGVISASLVLIGSLFKILHWPGASILLMTGFIITSLLFLPSSMYVMQKENKSINRPLLFVFAFLGVFGFITGILFKIMHWPGPAYLITGGVSILCFLFFPVLLVNVRKKAPTKKLKRIYTQGVLSAILFLLATHFKLMHWPGASLLLMIGSLSLIIFFVVPYSYYFFKNEVYIKPAFIYLIAGSAWFLLFTMLLSLNIRQDSVVQFDYLNEMLRDSLEKYEVTSHNIYGQDVDSTMYVELMNVQNETQMLIHSIHELKIEIMPTYGSVSSQEIEEEVRTDTHIPKFVLFGDESSPALIRQLKTDLLEYYDFLQSETNKYSDGNKIGSSFVPPMQENDSKSFEVWENHYFKDITAEGCIQLLTALEVNIRKAEFNAINLIITHAQKSQS